MSKLFFKYRVVIISGILLLSLLFAMFLKDGNVRDFFIGLATGVALVIFGQNISTVKSEQKNQHINMINEN